MALPAPCRLQSVPRPASKADLQEEAPFLGDLLLGYVGNRHLTDSILAAKRPLKRTFPDIEPRSGFPRHSPDM